MLFFGFFGFFGDTLFHEYIHFLFLCLFFLPHVTFDVREEAIVIDQLDSVMKNSIRESIGCSCGIAIKTESFVDIFTGVDPSKFAGKSGRIGKEVMQCSLRFGGNIKMMVDLGGPRPGELVSEYIAEV